MKILFKILKYVLLKLQFENNLIYFSLYDTINDPPPPYSETWENIKMMKIMLGITNFYMLCIENLPKIKLIYKVKYSSVYREWSQALIIIQ